MNRQDMRKLLDTARARGWTVERTGSGHLKLRHASGAILFTGTTLSDWRISANLHADMRCIEHANKPAATSSTRTRHPRLHNTHGAGR
jgi:hypothetical protein